jgi:glutamine synthetase
LSRTSSAGQCPRAGPVPNGAPKLLREAGRADLVTLVTTDYGGITRGRSLTRRDYERARGKAHCGWVPANMSLTPFDVIPEQNPWGSQGDLRLLADPQARYRVWPQGAATPLDFVMSDIVELDGRSWTCCPRSLLKRALADLEAETGCRLIAAFEQEFQLLRTGWPAEPSFGLSGLRRADPFGPEFMAALDQAGTEPEMFIREFGQDQFEITNRPAPALLAADRSIAVRAIAREVARLRGWHASFAPKTAVAGIGNGTHIHFSFLDRRGNPRTFDTKARAHVSRLAGAFAAGVMRHLPAMVAFTAGSPVSYLRLQPHRWSASYTWFGERDREASLRICPTVEFGGVDAKKQFNLEFRAVDATACPHLALAVLVRAGLEGIRAKLATPPIFSGDPTTLSQSERNRLGLRRLPTSLGKALEALAADKIVCGWFSARALDTYVGVKRMELHFAEKFESDALCKRYAEIY